MRRNIKNDKVIKAITIGLATMIAATSVPTNVYAEGEEQETTGTEQGGGSGTEATSTPSTSEQVASEVSSAQESVSDAISVAEAYEDNLSEVVSTDLQAAAEALTNLATDVQDESFVAAYDSVADAENKTDDLSDTLNSKYLQNSDIDQYKADRKLFDVERNEDGSLVLDETGNPVFGQNEEGKDYAKVEQLSGQYVGTDKSLGSRSVQGLYEDGVEDVQAAMTAENEDAAKGKITDATKKLDGAIERFDNSTEELRKAREEYAAAVAAAEKAEEDLAKAQDSSNAIQDSQTAADFVNAAKKNAERCAAARDQYYATIVQLYKDKNTTNNILQKNSDFAVYVDGKLDIDASAAKVTKAIENNEINGLKAGASESTYKLGRQLLRQLVEMQLIEDGVDPASIVWITDEKGKSATVGTVDEKGNIIFGETEKLKQDSGEKDNDGRTNHFTVTYTDADGNTQPPKYFNYIIKAADNGGQYNATFETAGNIHLENGPIFVSEIKKVNGRWEYVPYDSQNTTYLDNYKALVAAAEEKQELEEAVDAAADKVNEIKEEYDLAKRVATNRTNLDALKVKLDKAEAAYKKSKQSLEDLNDLIEAMSNKLGMDYEKRTIVGIDDVQQEDETSGPQTSAENDTDGGDGAAADTSDDAAGGATVIPGPGGFTYTIPGGFTLPATLLDGTTGTTGGTTTGSGVLGVRTGGGTEADEGGAADSRTNVAPRADFSTVNKVLGSRQNKDNSQIVKKIKDNEIPLAEIPNMDDEVTMNWMWLLIIFLLGATGKKMYDEYKKKKEAEEAAKINK